MGKKDFLLRQRVKGSTTPWAEIPPISIHQELPDFEIGIFNDIVNPEKNIKDNDNKDENIDDEMLQEIAQDLSKQNSQNEDMSQGTTDNLDTENEDY